MPYVTRVAEVCEMLREYRATYTYKQLAAEYPCIVVRTDVALNSENSLDLFQFNPGHCVIAGIHVTTVGIACRSIAAAFGDVRSAALE